MAIKNTDKIKYSTVLDNGTGSTIQDDQAAPAMPLSSLDESDNTGVTEASADTGTYTFTVTSANATTGATYTNNGHTFTVTGTISGATTLVTTGTARSLASGTLTKATGTGDATIAFSAVVAPLTFSFTLPANLIPGTVVIHSTLSSTAHNATDNGLGTGFTGDSNLASGTVNYTTGAVALTFTASLDAATSITADYNDNTGTIITSVNPQYVNNTAFSSQGNKDMRAHMTSMNIRDDGDTSLKDVGTLEKSMNFRSH